MKIELELAGKRFCSNLNKGIDISIPISPKGPRAWYVEPAEFKPVMTEHFTGSVALGGGVNFRDVYFNPHGHGTHTETVGHINEEIVSINQTLTQFFYQAELVTIRPEIFAGEESEYIKHGDSIVTQEILSTAFKNTKAQAIVIRTLPNDQSKLSRNYSDQNPTYFEPEALSWIRNCGIKHLLTDTPSVDREKDGGKMLAHRAYWHGNRPDDMECTITEMVYIPENVEDGAYLLNLQIAAFENDASPSKPILYPLQAL